MNTLKEIDVYLIAGQSNAAGYSFHEGLLTEEFDNIWYAGETDRFRDGNVRSCNLKSFKNFCFKLKAGFGTLPDRIGPEYGMAKVFNNLYSKEKPALIFKSAAGGTSLFNASSGESANYGNWYPRSLWEANFIPNPSSTTGLQYHNFITNFKKVFDELKANGYFAKIKGMVWMQGCVDAGNSIGYEPIIKIFINDIRNDLTQITGDNAVLKMPFIIGKIATSFSVHNNPFSCAFNEMQQRVADSMEDVYTVQTDDLIIVKADGTFKGKDQYHFASDDMQTLGMRFAKKLIYANKNNL